MNTVFMNSENNRTSEYNVLTLKLIDKLDLRRGQKTVGKTYVEKHKELIQ